MLQSLSNIDHWDINYIIYVAAITCKEFNNGVILSPSKLKRNQTPKWTTLAKASITNARRNIAQLEVVIKCKQENKFTKHQSYKKSYKVIN